MSYPSRSVISCAMEWDVVLRALLPSHQQVRSVGRVFEAPDLSSGPNMILNKASVA